MKEKLLKNYMNLFIAMILVATVITSQGNIITVDVNPFQPDTDLPFEY